MIEVTATVNIAHCYVAIDIWVFDGKNTLENIVSVDNMSRSLI